jgi:hypothetical protein
MRYWQSVIGNEIGIIPLLYPYIAILFVYFLSIGLGHYLIVGGLRFFLGTDRGAHPRAWGVGCIERFIYTSCLLLGLPVELIGGWLVLKGLAQFRPQGNDKASTEEFLREYYGYLIGIGFVLLGARLAGNGVRAEVRRLIA